MEQPSSSSKVTVEYFDPYGVYQLLSPGLLPRLPLRNLHWESHAGPLRSISTLHAELVPAAQEFQTSSSAEAASASTSSLSRVKSEDSAASGDDGFRTQALGQVVVERPESSAGTPKPRGKERRHQIPGLRQTPYLKVFFLRCDDNDTYKAQARRQVREWIKEHTPSIQSTTKFNAQENHDAFEWLIVHVIVPNTAAATQPRASGKSAERSSGSAEKSTARWRGGGSTTILEKLRADFNSSSKSAMDRVAQIRIGINDVPYDMLPRVVPAIPGSYTETQQENENSWLDLVSKFKSLILSSFDLRVSQYEEDIREKDAQRSLPGWNFCTFFVLKEGLARGFESVGLVEDALVGYDELAVGLDSIIREQAVTGPGAEHGGSFLPFTEDLRRQADRARNEILRETGAADVIEADGPIDLQFNTAAAENEATEIPLDASRKRYRELILSNDISIFDFRCYLFSRQLLLLLRIANAWSSQEELLAKLKEQRESSLLGVAARLPPSQPSEDVENLSVLGEICRRTMDFVASIARIMRDDIWASSLQTNQADETTESRATMDPVMAQAIDNIVSSFVFAIAQQILAQTSTKSLPIPPSTLAPPSSKMALDGQEPKAAIPEPKTMMHPARSSSLAIRGSSRESHSPNRFPSGRRSSVPEQGAAGAPFLKMGLEELAGHRAELYLLSRNILEKAGKERGWSSGWSEVAYLQASNISQMEEVDLSQDSANIETIAETLSNIPPSNGGIGSKLLRAALDNKDDFYRLFETLTDKALRHYTVANQIQSVQASMADLAILKYYFEDYPAAASYFYRMTPFYGEGGWTQVELSMLVMYAKCLKELQRKEEYVRVVLKLLSKAAASENERVKRKSILRLGSRDDFTQEVASIESYIPELLEITKTMQHEIRVPLPNLFGQAEIDGTIRYHPEKDSIGLQVRLLYLLADDFPIEKVRVRLHSIAGEIHREIWFETDGPLIVKKGSTKLLVQSNVVIPGTYVVNHISLQSHNITLTYEYGNTGPTTNKDDPFFKCPKLLIYHRSEAFNVELYSSRYMHLDRNRSLELILSSGWNLVNSGEIHIRAATAGLRLQTSEVKVAEGSVEVLKKSDPGVIRFSSIEAESTVKLVLPFSLEHEVNDISLKLEISYTTDKGKFFCAAAPSVSVMLPLGVNVQDFFKHKALFSKFTISSATSAPLRLLSSRLEPSETFEAQGGIAIAKPLVVFPRQPASMLYKITRSKSANGPLPASRKGPKSSLSLVLHYTCLDEEIDNAVSRELTQVIQADLLKSHIRLIVPSVLSELRARLSPYDLEKIATLSEVSVATLSTVRWRDQFLGLGRFDDQDVSIMIEDCLQTWLKRTTSIPLLPVGSSEDIINGIRSIIIPVDVPSVTVVHTADIKLPEQSPVMGNSFVATSNQPISALLTIKWTRIWDTEIQSVKINSAKQDGIEFFYEVTGASDSWLIGGRRKGHFRVPSNYLSQSNKEKLSFPVILIPLREGFIPFPNVDIKPAPVTKGGDAGVTVTQESPSLVKPAVTCETDYKNAGETIRVISDTRKTTVSLDASGPQGGAWLLESERRAAGEGGIALG